MRIIFAVSPQLHAHDLVMIDDRDIPISSDTVPLIWLVNKRLVILVAYGSDGNHYHQPKGMARNATLPTSNFVDVYGSSNARSRDRVHSFLCFWGVA